MNKHEGMSRKKRNHAVPSDAATPRTATVTEPAVERDRGLEGDELAVFKVLGAVRSPLHADEVCESTHLSIAAVMVALLCLVLKGFAIEKPSGFFSVQHGT